MDINIVYDAIKTTEILYEGPEGKVYYSPTRNERIPNVFQSLCNNPRPDDSAIMAEPIAVSPVSYNVDYLSKFKKVFGCFEKAFENTKIKEKYVCVNYGYDLKIHSPLLQADAESIKENWRSWNQRNGMIIIAGGSKGSNHQASIYCLRLLIADLFYQNNFEVAWYGQQHCNRPYYKGAVHDKVSEIGKYKFAICSENTYDPIYSHNYLTEKLPHAIYGGAVPLYMGCYNIDDIAPKNTFFDLRNFVLRDHGQVTLLREPLLEAINSFSQEKFEQYQEAAYQFIKDPLGINYHMDPNRVYKKILETLQ
jgi:hypothetical protein